MTNLGEVKTELTDAKEAGYHDHELNVWFGNFEGVRRKHHCQVKDANYDRALKLFADESLCGSFSAAQTSTEVLTETKNPGKRPQV